MIHNLIVLPDGTEVSSGTSFAIKSAKLTECVNAGEELSLGSTCANMLETTLFDVGAKLSLAAGDEVTLYRISDDGTRVKKGVFILEKPTRPSANTLKLTGYDRITKLSKDLSAWLNSVTGWPHPLIAFAEMVCDVCGLTLETSDIPNSDFPVYKPAKSSVTGRELMGWIGEICCRFCRANADGNIEFAWYEPSGVTVSPAGQRHYYQGALSYEAYQVAPIEAVQMRLADSESGILWPEAADGANSYIITGNAILSARVSADLLPYLQTIKNELSGVTYTPCEFAIPACLDVGAGSIVNVTDKNGKTITTYVMSKTSSGQRDTLQCTGSHRRDSAIPANAQTVAELDKKLDMTEVFNRLTKNGALKGLYMKDGEVYINASYIKTGELRADLIKAGLLESMDGRAFFDLDNGVLGTYSTNGSGVKIENASMEIASPSDGSWAPFIIDYDDENGTARLSFSSGFEKGLMLTAHKENGGDVYLELPNNDGERMTSLLRWGWIGGQYVLAGEGDFNFSLDGLIGYKRVLNDADDLDDLTECGIYRYTTSSAPANCPYSNAGMVEVIPSDGTSGVIQRVTRYGNAGYMKQRIQYGGDWLEWTQVPLVFTKTYTQTTNVNGNANTSIQKGYRILDITATDADGVTTYLCNKYWSSSQNRWYVNVTDVINKTNQANKEFTFTIYYMVE